MRPPADGYFTPASLAKRWGCCIDIIYDLLKSGKLRGFKLGKDWRIPDDAREAYEKFGGVPEVPEPKLRGRGKVLTRIT